MNFEDSLSNIVTRQEAIAALQALPDDGKFLLTTITHKPEEPELEFMEEFTSSCPLKDILWYRTKAYKHILDYITTL